jgi:hypothetical protein
MQRVKGRASVELRDEVWVDLFPWLDDYVSSKAAILEPLVSDVPDWWLSDSPRVTANEVDLEGVIDQLAEVFVTNHKALAFVDAFPRIDADLAVRALDLSVRSATVVQRLTSDSNVAALLKLTVADFFAVRGTSEQTVQELVRSFLTTAVLVDPTSGLELENEPLEAPAVAQLLDDLKALATWQRVRGRHDQPLIQVEIDDESPEVIQQVAARLTAITPLDLPDDDPKDAIDEIENLVSQLDDRELLVLHQRLMARTPVTLGELSTVLHLSKARTSGVEAALKNKLSDACGYGTAVGNLLASMRVEIQPVAALDRLLAKHPALAEGVPSLSVPLWLVLDRLDDYFEVTDQWAAAPDVNAARARTLALLEDIESPNGVASLDSAAELASMPHGELDRWLRWCGVPIVENSAVLRTKRLADFAVGALEAVGKPTTTEALAAIVDPGRQLSAIARVLHGDVRVSLDNDGLWSLGTPSGHLSASAGAETDTVKPERVRRLYRVESSWTYRITVSNDHLRGSSFAIPAGVAMAFGCVRGAVTELPSPLGVQMVRWTGPQATCGTIRRLLRGIASKAGDQVVLSWSPAEGFSVADLAVFDGEPLRAALAAIGHKTPEAVPESEMVRVLASAVGLDADAKPRRILSAYQGHDDHLVVSLLEKAWIRKTSADE